MSVHWVAPKPTTPPTIRRCQGQRHCGELGQDHSSDQKGRLFAAIVWRLQKFCWTHLSAHDFKWRRIFKMVAIGFRLLVASAATLLLFATFLSLLERLPSPSLLTLLPPPNPTTVVSGRMSKFESSFLSSLRQCLPASAIDLPSRPHAACQTSSKNIARLATSPLIVGVLSPPGAVYERARSLLASLIDDDSNVLISSSNLPPYGYGETVPYSHVVRIYDDSGASSTLSDALFSGGFTSLHSTSSFPSTPTSLSLSSSLRATVRFHCRLSALSAHTYVLSLPLVALYAGAAALLEGGDEAFLEGGSDAGTDLRKTIASFGVPLVDFSKNHMRLAERFRDLHKVLVEASKDVESRFSPTEVMRQSMILDGLLDFEYKMSDRWTAWPCPSLLFPGEDDGEKESIVMLAKEMTPICNGDDHFYDERRPRGTKCVVDRKSVV